MTILLFASIAEKVGKRRIDLSLSPGETVAQVCERLAWAHPQMRPYVPNLLYALDEEYVKADAIVTDGATLALIPPVSGG